MAYQITLNDGAASIYTAISSDSESDRFRGPAPGGVIAKAPTLVLTSTENTTSTKERAVFAVPFDVTVDGVVKSIPAYVSVNFTLPKSLGTTEKQKAMALVGSLISLQAYKDQVVTGVPMV